MLENSNDRQRELDQKFQEHAEIKQRAHQNSRKPTIHRLPPSINTRDKERTAEKEQRAAVHTPSWNKIAVSTADNDAKQAAAKAIRDAAIARDVARGCTRK
jgi:pyruvate/2-oxoglutarate/acetoin dehydrogenase E1 component